MQINRNSIICTGIRATNLNLKAVCFSEKMVLRELFVRLGVKSQGLYFFLAGFVYSLIAILVATMVFGQNIGLVAVFLVSIALMPSIHKLLGLSNLLEGRTREVRKENIYLTEITTESKKIGLKHLFEDYREIFKAYAFSFLGIFFAFALLALNLPQEIAQKLFGDQLGILAGTSFGIPEFAGLITHNMAIMMIVFAIALIYEFGATFVITWNATVWGTVFAIRAKAIAAIAASDPTTTFGIMILVVIWHTIIEAAAYFSGGIAGGILSRAFAKEKFLQERFNHIAWHAFLLLGLAIAFLVIAAFIEVNAFSLLESVV